MGHQLHFLQRLVERFAPDHARFALSLYYDSELVEATLRLADLPADADRLAIDLGSSGHGPYLVLTRTGHFVTCLAAGMNPGGLRVFSKNRFRKLLDRAKEQRRRKKLEVARGGLEALARRLHDSRMLAREDFDGLSAHVPDASLAFFSRHYDNWAQVERRREALLADRRGRTASGVAQLRTWSRYLRSLGPLLTLATLDPMALDRQLPKAAKGGDHGAHRAYTGFRHGVFDIAAQTLWALGRQGYLLWNQLAKRVTTTESRIVYIASAAGLCTAALRFPGRLPATRRLLLSELDFSHAGVRGPALSELHSQLAPIWEEILYFPDDCIASQAEVGSRLLAGVTGPRDGAPSTAIRELALTAAVQLHRGDFLNDGEALVELLRCIPWLASVDARELYLPERELAGPRAVWTMDDSRETLARWSNFWGKRVPDTRHRPARPNEPCPCGSLKKFKRCCESGTTGTSEREWWERTARAA